MCLLFETISCKDGELQNLKWHEDRMNKSRQLLWTCDDTLNLGSIETPSYISSGLWKCKVIYKQTILSVTFESYQPKINKSYKIVHSDIEYPLKYFDRTEINNLYGMKGGADEIIIVKEGFITDTSIGNILLYDGTTWYTPVHPLLPGTMRAKLLANGAIKSKSIKVEELVLYKKIMAINALNPFNPENAVDVSAILY